MQLARSQAMMATTRSNNNHAWASQICLLFGLPGGERRRILFSSEMRRRTGVWANLKQAGV